MSPGSRRTGSKKAGSRTANGTKVFAFTDGACSGNPGPGGWGALLQAVKDGKTVKQQELCGGAARTTNNRMELRAAIAALKKLNRASSITMVTDSQYVRNGITRWIAQWKSNDWRTSGRTPVKNSDLWRQLDDLCRIHDVRWKWVKGHADSEGNNRADALAREGMKKHLGKRSMAKRA